MSASAPSRLELPDSRAPQGWGLGLLGIAAAGSLWLSDMPLLPAFLIWMAALWAGWLALRRQPRASALVVEADARLGIEQAGQTARLQFVASLSYGPLLVLHGRADDGGLRRFLLLPLLLSAEHRRQLGRMLARSRPELPISV